MECLKFFRKLEKNKKGLDPDFTDAIMAIIFTALIFFFAFIFILNRTSGLQKAAEVQSENLEKNYVLLNYLRTPIESDNINIAQFLGSKKKTELLNSIHGTAGIGAFCGVQDLSGIVSGPDKDGILVKETKNILEDVKDWRVNMYVNGKEFCVIKEGKGINRAEGDITGETVMALIPSIDPNVKSIEIYFKLNVFGFSTLSSI